MGLHAAILKWLKSICPKAFRLGENFDFQNAVFVHDVLTFLRRQKGPRPDGAFTGSELFRTLSTPLFARLEMGSRIEVVSCDIYEHMPAFKGKEQAKRDESKLKADEDAKPYPDDSDIADDGILVPGVHFYAPFEIHRVLSSRKVARETLMRYLDHRFRAIKDRIPPGCAIVMDYSASGPILITRHYTGPMVLAGGYTRNLDKKPRILRQHGEADHALPFWLRVFKDRLNKFVDTVDRDVLMHVLAYITTSVEPVKGSITWTYVDDKTRQNMQVDMVMLARQVLAQEYRLRFPRELGTLQGVVNCTLMQFLFRCIFTKTDFLTKDRITPRIGEEAVFSGLQKCGPQINAFRVPLAQLRERERKWALAPVGDCDPFYIHDRPDLGALAALIPLPTSVVRVVTAYAFLPDIEVAVTDSFFKLVDSTLGPRCKSFECRNEVMRILQYILVNWNDLELLRDPVERYFSFEPDTTRPGKRARDEDQSDSRNMRAKI